jgi:UDP-glucose 4-epimerase
MDSNTKILVTGAGGFIGSHLCKALIKKGYSEIHAVDDLSGTEGSAHNIKKQIENKSLNFYEIDLSDNTKTRYIIDKIKPEIVYHLASSARESASFFDPVKITKTNYTAYINTLESSIKTGQLDKMILFSSMAVYGGQQPPFYEKMERRPVDIYGINKAAMEHSTELLSKVHDFKYVIIRPHNVYGEYQSLRDKYRNVLAIWMNEIMRNEPVTIYGDGNQIRGFSYVQNSLNCYINAINKNCDNEIINLGGKKLITINNASKLILESMGADDTYPINYISGRYGEVKIAYCSWDKSDKLLGYKEKISLEDGINNMAKWAQTMGPQEWTTEKLELSNDKCPAWWN